MSVSSSPVPPGRLERSIAVPLYAEQRAGLGAPDERAVGRDVDRHGILMSVMTQLTGGVYLTGFALALGAPRSLIGLLAAVPFLVKLSQLFLSWSIERSGRWKWSALAWAGFGRASLLLAAAIPFLSTAPPSGAIALVGVVAAASLGGSVFEMSYLTWMAELIPAPRRGEFFGRRARVVGFAGLAVSVAAGFLVDRVRETSPGSLGVFGALFGLGAGAGLLGLLYLRRVPGPRRKESRVRPIALREALSRPARDANYRRLLRFSAFWGFAGGVIAPFYTVLMLEQLRLPFLYVSAIAAATAAVMSLVQLSLGRLGDQFGYKSALRAGTYLIALTPLVWFLVRPDRLWPLFFLPILGGFGWGAYHLSMSNLILKLSPEHARPSYLAAFGAVQGTAEASAPIVGGLLLDSLALLDLGALPTMHILMGVSFALFALSAPLLGYIREPGGATVGHMIRVTGRFQSMETGVPREILFDHIVTHLARIADFVAREPLAERDGKEPRPRPVRA